MYWITSKLVYNVGKLIIFFWGVSSAYTLIPSPKLPLARIHSTTRCFIFIIMAKFGFDKSDMYTIWRGCQKECLFLHWWQLHMIGQTIKCSFHLQSFTGLYMPNAAALTMAAKIHTVHCWPHMIGGVIQTDSQQAFDTIDRKSTQLQPVEIQISANENCRSPKEYKYNSISCQPYRMKVSRSGVPLSKVRFVLAAITCTRCQAQVTQEKKQVMWP